MEGPGRLVVLVSGTGTNLQALLDASASGRLPARVVGVVSNRASAGGLDRAVAAGVPAVALPPTPGEPRREYDARLADVVERHAADVVVLAGWMRLLSTAFLDRFPGRVVNLHPALPGELPGTQAIERAHAEALAGTRTRTGVMVHLVPDEGVDDGPVLASVEVPIDPDESLDSLAARVHAAEHELLVDTVTALLRHRRPDQPPTSHPHHFSHVDTEAIA